MQENEQKGKKERKKKKRKYLFCESIWVLIVIFLVKFNKVFTAVIRTVNHLVYAINGEV